MPYDTSSLVVPLKHLTRLAHSKHKDKLLSLVLLLFSQGFLFLETQSYYDARKIKTLK